MAGNRSPRMLLAFACTGALVAGCGGATDDRGNGSKASADGDRGLGHIHALGVDPADDAVYVAAHEGIFRVADGEADRVAGRAQDAMGFVVVGPGHFLSSGHPDPTENLPPSLGLMESTDAGLTWRPLSLLGEADLHAIEPVGDRIYAYDSTSQALIVTDDGQRWRAIAQLLPIRDLAVDPARPDTVYATSDDGALLRSTGGADPSPVYGAPHGLIAIDWEPQGPLVAVSRDGSVLVSPDAATWSETGSLGGPVEALDVTPGRWLAATAAAVLESTDDGRSWDVVLDRAVDG